MLKATNHIIALACLGLAACAPELNWRDVQAGAGEQAREAQLQFPCKPQRQTRKLVMSDKPGGDAPVSFTLLACHAGDMSFALGAAEMGDAEAASATLGYLSRKLAQNLQATPPEQTQPFTPKGATLDQAAQRIVLQGKRPEGEAMTGHAAFFRQGARVYQATVTAPASVNVKALREAADLFFNSIALVVDAASKPQ